MDFLENLNSILESKKLSETAKLFMSYPSIIDKVIAFRELCKVAKLNSDVKKLNEILNGDLTRTIPLMTVGRFYKKYFGNFGKTLTFGRKGKIIKISMGEIDTAFTEITGVLYSIYLKLVKNDE